MGTEAQPALFRDLDRWRTAWRAEVAELGVSIRVLPTRDGQFRWTVESADACHSRLASDERAAKLAACGALASRLAWQAFYLRDFGPSHDGQVFPSGEEWAFAVFNGSSRLAAGSASSSRAACRAAEQAFAALGVG